MYREKRVPYRGHRRAKCQEEGVERPKRATHGDESDSLVNDPRREKGTHNRKEPPPADDAAVSDCASRRDVVIPARAKVQNCRVAIMASANEG